MVFTFPHLSHEQLNPREPPGAMLLILGELYSAKYAKLREAREILYHQQRSEIKERKSGVNNNRQNVDGRAEGEQKEQVIYLTGC